ncbi:hypothetical protein N665_0035s0003 [Sinapis alba]|nr:hypothetical protein N665_0035s0003 [Sinapis alba]
MSFLRHVGFYRRFIKDFSKIARPLTTFLCMETKFEFNSDCLAAFHTIKGTMISALIVQPPDWDLPFEIMTDASDFAVGALLGQRKDKKMNVIYYARRKMDEAQCCYATTEKEFLKIVFAFEKFRSYLGTDDGVADHLSRMKMDEETSLDDSLLVENICAIDLHVPEQSQECSQSKGAPTPCGDEDGFQKLRFQGIYITVMVLLTPNTLQPSEQSPRFIKSVSGGKQCSRISTLSSPNETHASDRGISEKGMKCLITSF